MIITLLGAESTGKSVLAQALAQHLQAQGTDAVAVQEYLREWCAAHGRTPQQHEQLHIAATQQQRIDAARAQHRVVIADTTALMTAVYSEFVFGDRSLYVQAIAQQHKFDITLVTGLDMPWQADGIQRDGEHVRAPVDTLVRNTLNEAGIAYQMVYGLDGQRLDNAMHCIAARAGIDWASSPKPAKNWVWACDKCSDPDCEHQLFTKLTAPLSARADGPAAG
jgi:nicotinamide riboside kinase